MDEGDGYRGRWTTIDDRQVGLLGLDTKPETREGDLSDLKGVLFRNSEMEFGDAIDDAERQRRSLHRKLQLPEFMVVRNPGVSDHTAAIDRTGRESKIMS